MTDKRIHVCPTNDLRDHVEEGEKPCWCNPTIDDDLVIHNAMDQRETYEQGRKPS